jgi:hypothetical protein
MSNPSRPSSDKQRLGLKMAVRRVIAICGDAKDVAQLTAVNASMLSLYCAPHEEDRHARIDVALDLDLAAGEPVIARALAAAQGYELVRTSAVEGAGKIELGDLGRLRRESFEAEETMLASVAESQLTAAKRRKILKELADLRQAITSIEAKVETQ